MKILYGVWDGVPFDNRGSEEELLPAGLEKDLLEVFDPDNPIEAFFCHRGFCVMKENIDLIDLFHKYWKTAEENSCGKCTPCRAGTSIIRDTLEKAVGGMLTDEDLVEVSRIASLMADSSFCGLGQTVPASLLGAIKYFPEELRTSDGRSRAKDFYSLSTAPCIEACPANVNIPRYIDYIREGRPEMAAGVLLRHYPFVGSCGRVCVHYCESACRRSSVEASVDIKNLKRFAADSLGVEINKLFHRRRRPRQIFRDRVAVVGAGPAGITCAYHLLLEGYDVDVFEATDRSGGMTLTGIPEYRLPKVLVRHESSRVIENLGGRFLYSRRLGIDFSVDDLFDQGYKAVFLGIGCENGSMLGFEEDANPPEGYMNGIDFLRGVEKKITAGDKYELKGDTVVVGCGNVAMDCCRSATRLSKDKVSIVYRRTENLCPADPVELHDAHEEGVEFNWLTAQKRLVVEENKVVGLECVKLRVVGDPNSRRSKLEEIPDSRFVIPCSNVIGAIGQQLNKASLCESDGIKLEARGKVILADGNLLTSREGVFAGGDCVLGPRTFIEAMAQGEKAAHSIHYYLADKKVPFDKRQAMSKLVSQMRLFDDSSECRPVILTRRDKIHGLEPEERDNFEEVEHGFTKYQAIVESRRCMRCYRVLAVALNKPVAENVPISPTAC